MKTIKVAEYTFQVIAESILNIAVCEGRHDIPNAKDGAIFPFEVNPFDFDGMSKLVENRLSDFTGGKGVVNLYITGMTSAVLEIVKYCTNNDVNLVCWHFNSDTNNYIPQAVNAIELCPFCGKSSGNGWICKSCGAM